jgi:hypothetical protein
MAYPGDDTQVILNGIAVTEQWNERIYKNDFEKPIRACPV